MKKIMMLILIVVLVLGVSVISFGQFYGGRNRGFSSRGYGPGMMSDDYNYDGFGGYGPGMMGPGFGAYTGYNTGIEILSDLTGLTEEEIIEKQLPMHLIAEEAGVEEAFFKAMLDAQEERINTLVESGEISEAHGEFMIERMTEMHEYMLSEDYEGSTFGFRRSGGFCHGQ